LPKPIQGGQALKLYRNPVRQRIAITAYTSFK
jgi:hypothetical protein